MSLSLEGKNALVTGSSRGIGRAIAERLAGDGAAVVIHYARSKQPAQAVVNKILAENGKAIAFEADISKPPEVRRLFTEAEAEIGRLHIVVANAGVHTSKPLVENTEADYDYIFDTNIESSDHLFGGKSSEDSRAIVRRSAQIVTPEFIHTSYDTLVKLSAGAFMASGASRGNSAASQASIPPARGRTLVIPFLRSSSATRALVASLGHEQ